MITDSGKEIFLRYLAQKVPGVAEYMVFGIGDASPAPEDEVMQFEYFRSPIDLVDYEEGTLVFRATIPTMLDFDVYEVGLLVNDETGVDGISPQEIITSFDQADEAEWDGYTLGTGRTGLDSFQLEVPQSSTGTLTRLEPFGEFGDIPANDTFALAYSCDNAPTQMEIRFVVSPGNYRYYTWTPSVGFNVERWRKADFSEEGTAPWDDFQSLEIIVTAGGSATTVTFDGLRLDSSEEEQNVLVARDVLAEPIEKRGVREVQVEYRVNLSFN
jgi:hypothetical protein